MLAIYRSWRAFTRRCLLATPVLLALSVWFCYDRGTITQTDNVVITWATQDTHYDKPVSGMRGAGGRIGGWVTDYTVHCRTWQDKPCWIDVYDLQDFLNYQAKFHTGEPVTTEINRNKPYGVFAWTSWGKFFAWAAAFSLITGILSAKMTDWIKKLH